MSANREIQPGDWYLIAPGCFGKPSAVCVLYVFGRQQIVTYSWRYLLCGPYESFYVSQLEDEGFAIYAGRGEKRKGLLGWVARMLLLCPYKKPEQQAM